MPQLQSAPRPTPRSLRIQGDFFDYQQNGFDGIGNLTSFTDANGTVTYFYDPVNNLTKLTGPGGSPVVKFTVTEDNLRTTTMFPSGVGDSTATAYDQANRPCLIVTAPSANIPTPLTCSSSVSGALTSYSYNYQDPSSHADNSRIQSVTNNVTDTTTSYQYRPNGELCWAYTGTSDQGCLNPPAGATSYGADPAGNINTVTQNGSTTSPASATASPTPTTPSIRPPVSPRPAAPSSPSATSARARSSCPRPGRTRW